MKPCVIDRWLLCHKSNCTPPRCVALNFFAMRRAQRSKVVGYNDNERSKFIQSITKDYILWFTKVGSIERMFGIEALKDFKLRLKCLDADTAEEIAFGHPFPLENSDINELFERYGSEGAGHYVRRELKQRVRTSAHPEVTFDMVISVEGDAVKRQYNPMLRDRGRAATGTYRVLDRYGVWLCKDFIRSNE